MKSLIVLGERKFLRALKDHLQDKWEVQLDAEPQARSSRLVCAVPPDESQTRPSEAGSVEEV